MHENEALRMKCSKLEQILTSTDSSLLDERKKVLEKLQVLETFASVVENQNKIIDAQGFEMVDMTRDMMLTKEDSRYMHETAKTNESLIAMEKKECDELKAEVSRLRKAIIDISIKQTEKSKAYTSKWNKLSEPSFETSSSLGLPKLSQSQSQLQPLNSTHPNRSFISSKDKSHTSFHFNDSSVLSGPLDSILTKSNSCTDHSIKQKTNFVGSGLGLRKDEAVFSPKGSAKQVLRDIMNDFYG
jgi:hypothetical protein